MSEMIGEDNIQQYLTAFADGELDAAQILAVLDYLAEHPDGLRLMQTQQRLRLAADRAVRTLTPPPSADLRRRLEALAPPATPWHRRMNWRLPAVAASFLVVGMVVGRMLLAPRPSVQQPIVVAAKEMDEDAVPAVTVAHAMRIHADCSRLQEGLHTAGYPKELKGLADSVARDLVRTEPYPDLSGLGYRYIGAGPCADPLKDTIHLLYRSAAPGSKHAVSVFVQLHRGQLPINPGKLYVVSGPRSPFPMYAWRTEHIVYFLIADDEATVREARQAIAGAPPL